MNIPPTVADLTGLLYGASGQTVDATKGAEVLSTVTQLANAYTRGVGFTTNGVPNADISAVILTASARLYTNPTQLFGDQTYGPSSVSHRSAFQGWTVSELTTLDRYRVKAV
jgi:hypothetical protein